MAKEKLKTHKEYIQHSISIIGDMVKTYFKRIDKKINFILIVRKKGKKSDAFGLVSDIQDPQEVPDILHHLLEATTIENEKQQNDSNIWH